MSPEQFFAGNEVGLSAFRKTLAILGGLSGVSTRVSKSQIAFRVDRGFAYLWVPGRYLSNPAAPVVLSIVLPRRVESERFKEVVHPSKHWIHHLELNSPEDIDDEVREWLREAREAVS